MPHIFKAGRDKPTYEATEKGMDFLQRYNEIANLTSDLRGSETLKHRHQSSLRKIRSELGELRKSIDSTEADLSNAINCPECEESIFSDYRFDRTVELDSNVKLSRGLPNDTTRN